jgi:hypothetical protein
MAGFISKRRTDAVSICRKRFEYCAFLCPSNKVREGSWTRSSKLRSFSQFPHHSSKEYEYDLSPRTLWKLRLANIFRYSNWCFFGWNSTTTLARQWHGVLIRSGTSTFAPPRGHRMASWPTLAELSPREAFPISPISDQPNKNDNALPATSLSKVARAPA